MAILTKEQKIIKSIQLLESITNKKVVLKEETGPRGGNIIGHTKSGKAIYASA